MLVRFHLPVIGTDPLDAYTFTADRHKVAARWARQDEHETIFVDDTGEIVSRWPTSEISHIQWPHLTGPVNSKSVNPDGRKVPIDTASPEPRAGTLDWREKVQRDHPKAYQRWTEVEDNELAEEFGAGMTVREMSTRHQRRQGGIMARLVRLGLIEPTTRESSIGTP